MPYFKIIKNLGTKAATGTWVCPADGYYKIVVVAAGRSGSGGSPGSRGDIAAEVIYYTVGQSVNYSIQKSGEYNDTYFGTVSVGAGAVKSLPPIITGAAAYSVGGEGGYTIDGVYGGGGAVSCQYNVSDALAEVCFMDSTKNGGMPGTTGTGFGAGGGVVKAVGGAVTYTAPEAGGVIIQEV